MGGPFDGRRDLRARGPLKLRVGISVLEDRGRNLQGRSSPPHRSALQSCLTTADSCIRGCERTFRGASRIVEHESRHRFVSRRVALFI